jgi:hypothetical protein
MTGQSYLGAVTAFLGIWAVFTGDWTAVGWAVLMVAIACGKRYLDDDHLLIQSGAFAASVLIVAYLQNSHQSELYPHHIVTRLITFPILAAAFYLLAWILSGVDDVRVSLRIVALWSGSALLASLAWLDIKQTWVALAWVAFAALLSVVGRRLRIPELTYQEHALAVFATAQLVGFNIYADAAIERYIPLAGCAVAFYAISRSCTMPATLPIAGLRHGRTLGRPPRSSPPWPGMNLRSRGSQPSGLSSRLRWRLRTASSTSRSCPGRRISLPFSLSSKP